MWNRPQGGYGQMPPQQGMRPGMPPQGMGGPPQQQQGYGQMPPQQQQGGYGQMPPQQGMRPGMPPQGMGGMPGGGMPGGGMPGGMGGLAPGAAAEKPVTDAFSGHAVG